MYLIDILISNTTIGNTIYTVNDREKTDQYQNSKCQINYLLQFYKKYQQKLILNCLI